MNIILCDIDGCLTKGKNYSLQLQELQEIKEFIKIYSGNFSLCTGRSQPYVELFCQMLDIKTPCICENGSYLYDPYNDKVIYPPETGKKNYDDLLELKKTVIPSLLKRVNFSYEPGKDASISINSSLNIRFLYKLLKKDILQYGFSITHSNSAVDITLKNIDKGTGFEWFKEYTDHPYDITIGIGDAIGDLPFLIKSDFVCSPLNADEDVKKISHFVSKNAYSSGVNEILKNIHLFT